MNITLLPRHRQWLVSVTFGSLAVVAMVLAFGACTAAPPVHSTESRAGDRSAGLQAFSDVASVLRSPRCLNCHPAGDVPRQADLGLPHFPVVARGPDGHGITGMRCNACHQETNQANGVPGAPHWGLAPRSMAWVGLNDHELAEQLKDPQRNGRRTLEQMIEHVSTEGLVLWSWQPGGERSVPPLTHGQFVQRFKDWVAAGAPSPRSPHE